MSRKPKHDDRFRVLVVDDHARARDAVADVLRQAQYHVAACASASEALVKLAGEKFDVVITDLQMPGMNGLEFIREIERRRFDVQVLMITAHASVVVGGRGHAPRGVRLHRKAVRRRRPGTLGGASVRSPRSNSRLGCCRTPQASRLRLR